MFPGVGIEWIDASITRSGFGQRAQGRDDDPTARRHGFDDRQARRLLERAGVGEEIHVLQVRPQLAVRYDPVVKDVFQAARLLVEMFVAGIVDAVDLHRRPDVQLRVVR